MDTNLKLGEKKILEKIKEECNQLAKENNRPVGIFYDRAIKEILSEYKSDPSDDTKLQYRKIFKRLIQDPKNKGSALSIMLMNAGSRASFDLYRSAFRFCISELIEDKRKEAENFRRNKDYEAMQNSTYEALKLSVVFKYQFLSHEKITFSDVKTKDDYKKKVRSKKKNLSKLVEYSDMINSLNPAQKERYAIPLTIYGLFGVRPAELQKGIKLVSAEEDGNKVIYAEIEGAKVNKINGQEKRYCKIVLDLESTGDVELFNLVESNGGNLTYSQNSQNYHALRKLMNRNFNGASPYSYRHRVASDLKASGLNKTTVAMFLGHANDKSQSHYGYKQHGKSRGMSATATKDVREVASDYNDYLDKKAFENSRKAVQERFKAALKDSVGSTPGKRSRPQLKP